MFLQQFSPTTGKMEWIEEDEDYEMKDEIARSAFADMLHDEERNQKYYMAAKIEVEKLKRNFDKLHMLDIGTGSGLLAMMAVKSGADMATACEAFTPVAKVAPKIIDANHFGDKIKVVPKRSTDLTVGQEGDCDMKSRAQLLVTELWDTELIGEGALPTLRDACKRLLVPGFVAVPAAGTIYAQVFHSKALWDMHQLDPDQVPKPFKIPEKMTNCLGTACGFDLHVDELRMDEISLLSKPIPILRFDFCHNSIKTTCPNVYSIPDFKESDVNKVAQYSAVVKATTNGIGHGVVMWWSLDMDMEGKITLEMAPKWAHIEGDNCQWRDHWMQAVYFLKKPLNVSEGQDLKVYCCHDDYSLWFDVQQHISPQVLVERPLCVCGGHTSWSRHRYNMLNDAKRNKTIKKALTKLVDSGSSSAVCISDASLLPLSALSVGFQKVVSTDSSISFTKLFKKLLSENDLNNRIYLLDKPVSDINQSDLADLKVDAIIGEPFFSTSLFPWNSLYFWYASTKLQTSINSDMRIMPVGATLKGIAVQFKDLWKYHAAVNWVEGFDLTHFDDLIQSSKLSTNDARDCKLLCVALEPHHVWEYPCQPLSDVFTLMEFDFTKPVPDKKIEQQSSTKITGSGTLHAVVLWMDFHLDEELTLSCGLQGDCCLSKNLDWVRHTKQAVYFFYRPQQVSHQNGSLSNITEFEPSQGEMEFGFKLKL